MNIRLVPRSQSVRSHSHRASSCVFPIDTSTSRSASGARRFVYMSEGDTVPFVLKGAAQPCLPGCMNPQKGIHHKKCPNYVDLSPLSKEEHLALEIGVPSEVFDMEVYEATCRYFNSGPNSGPHQLMQRLGKGWTITKIENRGAGGCDVTHICRGDVTVQVMRDRGFLDGILAICIGEEIVSSDRFLTASPQDIVNKIEEVVARYHSQSVRSTGCSSLSQGGG